MTCPKCGSATIKITTEQQSSKTATKNAGCLWQIGRLFLIICTCGLWLIIGKRSKTSRTQYTYKTVGICQTCGNTFDIISE